MSTAVIPTTYIGFQSTRLADLFGRFKRLLVLFGSLRAAHELDRISHHDEAEALRELAFSDYANDPAMRDELLAAASRHESA